MLGKKELSLQYVDWISKFIVKPTQLKEKLEENPMKVNKFLIELTKYKDKKPTSEREGVLITYKGTQSPTPRNILLTLESMYVNVESKWDLTHSVLTIGDSSYTIGSGHCDFTEERFKRLSKDKGLLLEVDATKLKYHKLYFKEQHVVKDEVVTGEVILKLPLVAKDSNVISYYQQKWPNRNYSLDSKTIKKKLSERSQKLSDLPKLGETPAKELRKVCYQHKKGKNIFRGPYVTAKKHVDSGDYEFVSKSAWKRQIRDDNDKIITQRGANISNIIHSHLGRELREKTKQREENKTLKQEQHYKKLVQQYASRHKISPGDAERKLQSEKDKKAYAEKCKLSSKKRIAHPVYRSYEAVILGDKAVVQGTLHIKAKSNSHAEAILKTIMKQKQKPLQLTGTVRDWIVQTGKSRLTKPNLKKPGTKKPRLDNPT